MSYESQNAPELAEPDEHSLHLHNKCDPSTCYYCALGIHDAGRCGAMTEVCQVCGNSVEKAMRAGEDHD